MPHCERHSIEIFITWSEILVRNPNISSWGANVLRYSANWHPVPSFSVNTCTILIYQEFRRKRSYISAATQSYSPIDRANPLLEVESSVGKQDDTQSYRPTVVITVLFKSFEVGKFGNTNY